jgi:exopolysaccharide biosynthesis protein
MLGRLLLSILWIVTGIMVTVWTAQAEAIRYHCTTVQGVPVKVISVDLNSPQVKVTGMLNQLGVGHTEPFQQMVRRANPTVAVTGTFHCNRTFRPVGDIVIGGKLTHFGGLGTALCVSEDNRVEFVRPKRYRRQDWSRYDYVLCAGPRLVHNRVAYVEPAREGFRDRHMLSPNPRIAIGTTRDKRLTIVLTRKPIYLSRMAGVIKALGVEDAINLDGGSSIGVYYKGKILVNPQRKLTNILLIYQDRNRYEKVKDRLLPVYMRSVKR